MLLVRKTDLRNPYLEFMEDKWTHNLDENATIQPGEEETQEMEMGEMTLFGSLIQDHANWVTEGQQVGQVGCSPVRMALRRSGGRKPSLGTFGASEKEQVWWKGQESEVESLGFARWPGHVA